MVWVRGVLTGLAVLLAVIIGIMQVRILNQGSSMIEEMSRLTREVRLSRKGGDPCVEAS